MAGAAARRQLRSGAAAARSSSASPSKRPLWPRGSPSNPHASIVSSTGTFRFRHGATASGDARRRARSAGSGGWRASSRRLRDRFPQRVPRREVPQNDLACFFSCSRFGRSGSWRGVIHPPCWSLWFANRQHGGVHAVGSIRTERGLGPSREPAGAVERALRR